MSRTRALLAVPVVLATAGVSTAAAGLGPVWMLLDHPAAVAMPVTVTGVGIGPGVGLALDRAAAAGAHASSGDLLAAAYPGTTVGALPAGVGNTVDVPVWTGPVAQAGLSLPRGGVLSVPGARPRTLRAGTTLAVPAVDATSLPAQRGLGAGLAPIPVVAAATVRPASLRAFGPPRAAVAQLVAFRPFGVAPASGPAAPEAAPTDGPGPVPSVAPAPGVDPGEPTHLPTEPSPTGTAPTGTAPTGTAPTGTAPADPLPTDPSPSSPGAGSPTAAPTGGPSAVPPSALPPSALPPTLEPPSAVPLPTVTTAPPAPVETVPPVAPPPVAVPVPTTGTAPASPAPSRRDKPGASPSVPAVPRGTVAAGIGSILDAGRGVVMVGATGASYRGSMVVVDAGAGQITLVNRVSLDDVARGTALTGGDSTADLPQPALRALAIAARGLALTGNACSAGCPTYAGASAETPQLDAAVAATSNRVVLWRGEPARTPVTVDGGGSTAPAGETGETAPSAAYLPGAAYTYAARPWQVGLTTVSLAQSLDYPGSITSVHVASRLPSGRVGSVRLTGSAGNRVLPGAVVERELSLPSTLFTFGGSTDLPTLVDTSRVTGPGAIVDPHVVLAPTANLGALSLAGLAPAVAPDSADDVPAPELAPDIAPVAGGRSVRRDARALNTGPITAAVNDAHPGAERLGLTAPLLAPQAVTAPPLLPSADDVAAAAPAGGALAGVAPTPPDTMRRSGFSAISDDSGHDGAVTRQAAEGAAGAAGLLLLGAGGLGLHGWWRRRPKLVWQE